MVILRVYNNNVLQARRNGRDVIVQGKGIAFGKRPGDHIPENDDYRIYELTDTVEYEQIKSLLDVIPTEYWDFADQAQSFAEERLGESLGVGFYFALLDHFYAAVDRAKKGIVISDFLLADVQLYYRQLYDLSKEIVYMAESTFNVTFGRSETYFVMTHLLDATLGAEKMIELDEAVDVVNCVIEEVKRDFDTIVDEESYSYMRFLTHLGMFAGRVIVANQDKSKRNENKYSEMFKALKEAYPKHTKCLDRIVKKIEKQFGYRVSEDEGFFLLLHLTRITEMQGSD